MIACVRLSQPLTHISSSQHQGWGWLMQSSSVLPCLCVFEQSAGNLTVVWHCSGLLLETPPLPHPLQPPSHARPWDPNKTSSAEFESITRQHVLGPWQDTTPHANGFHLSLWQCLSLPADQGNLISMTHSKENSEHGHHTFNLMDSCMGKIDQARSGESLNFLLHFWLSVPLVCSAPARGNGRETALQRESDGFN